MKRRTFVRLLGGGSMLAGLPGLSGCSSEIPAEAIAAWQGPANEASVREWILGYAILAPHSHNLQSWLVDLRQPEQISLYCDPGRLLLATDPYSRQIMISHGAFIELLDIAARERGLRANIELFPEGEFAAKTVDLRPVARIHLAADSSVRKDPLFAQIPRRRTNREAYEPRGIPTAVIADITESAATHSVRLGFAGDERPDLLVKLRQIAAEAWRIELVTPQTILESYQLLRVGPEEIAKHRDGLSLNELLPRLLVSLGLFDRSRAPAPDDLAVTRQIRDFSSKLDATPAFFWMITEGNDRKTQVNAGRAYARAQLAATSHGLAMQPVSQALQEYPEVSAPYAEIHRVLGAPQPRYTVQMFARLGYAPAIGPSPRRGVKAQIVAS